MFISLSLTHTHTHVNVVDLALQSTISVDDSSGLFDNRRRELQETHNLVRNVMNLTASLEDNHISLELMVKVNEGKVLNSTLGTLLSHPVCLALAVDSWGFPVIDISTEGVDVDVDCLDCSSPDLFGIIDRMREIKSMPDLVNFLNINLNNTGLQGEGMLRALPKWVEGTLYESVLTPWISYNCPKDFDEMTTMSSWLSSGRSFPRPELAKPMTMQSNEDDIDGKLYTSCCTFSESINP